MKKIREHIFSNKISEIIFIAFTVLNILGFCMGEIPFIIICVTGLWISNLIFCFVNIKERILYFWLQVTIGVFLIGRPLLNTIENKRWWNVEWLGEDSVYTALLIIAISLWSMHVGALLISCLKAKGKSKAVIKSEPADRKEKREAFRKNMQVISMLMYYATAFFFVIAGFEKVFFVHSHSYLEYYSEFTSHLPGIVPIAASLMNYSLCMFLATFPAKRRTFCALFLFEITAVFDLVVGVRGPIVLHSVFILVYYLLRDFLGDKEKWIGKIEKGLLAVCTPSMLIFMTAYAYIRSGLRVLDANPFNLIKGFFVSQGVTFEVVARGITVQNQLPQRAVRNYTFGSFIDYIVHGRAGQLLFGTEALPSGNNVINGTQSNSLAHNLSYVTRGKEYLQGKGWGSSYVLENYIDFGIAGVVLFSLILGMLLVLFTHLLKKNLLLDTIILVSLLNIFYIPRAEATGWLTFIITIQFWFCMACCYIGTATVIKVPVLERIFDKMKLLPPPDVKIKSESKIHVFINRYKLKKYVIALSGVIVLGCGLLYYRQTANKLEGELQTSLQTKGAEYAGRRVSFEVNVKNGNGEYEYKFSEVFNGKRKTIQEYSSDNKYVFIIDNVGDHVYYVDFKDSDGKKGTLSYTIKVTKRPNS
ncbi:O-antigen polysaccharide polymerase Wzy family protein [[Clostridium] hylemonae]|uniref:O-antigen polysaccharide polymerase Wzy family protein n=1 Tax=[Clostridium] hylemonae TaxID=89153 RepID=UPI001FCAE8E4|nr:O-antigen polysaccharide polymerase Wzy family protein [[Clostridium] hylemonae]BDF04171.1 hypothetical protein CE91St63_12330 [[Clostridium] hylemonae]